MYAKTTILAALLAVAPLAQAGESAPAADHFLADPSVAELARDSGLSKRKVRMLLGARTPYFEYRCCYSRILRQFKQAVGEDTYRRLVQDAYPPAGHPATAAGEAVTKEDLATSRVAAL